MPWTKSDEPVDIRNERIFKSHIMEDPAGTGCWLWTGASYSGPKGRRPYLWVKQVNGSLKQEYARRFIWMWANPGVVLDSNDAIVNVCECATCVNPSPGHNRRMRRGDWYVNPEQADVTRLEGGGVQIKFKSKAVPNESDFHPV